MAAVKGVVWHPGWTRGQWHLWTNTVGAFTITLGTKGDGAVLAGRNDWNHNAEESQANARLFFASRELFVALRDITEWWAYAMAKPDGAQPSADDHKKVEQLAVQAINALHAADPTYVHSLPKGRPDA